MLITDDDMILHMANNMPKPYEGLARHFERQILSNIDPLKYNYMIALLKNEYCRVKLEDIQIDNTDDMAYGALNNISSQHNNQPTDKLHQNYYYNEHAQGARKQYRGQYRVCGNYGHCGNDCFYNDTNAHKCPYGWEACECFFCHRKGHTEKYCFKRMDKENNNCNRHLNRNVENDPNKNDNRNDNIGGCH